MADALDELDLDTANADAWRLFQSTVTRFSLDTHTTGALFDRLTADLDAEAMADLIARFTVLYDIVCPPPKQES